MFGSGLRRNVNLLFRQGSPHLWREWSKVTLDHWYCAEWIPSRVMHGIRPRLAPDRAGADPKLADLLGEHVLRSRTEWKETFRREGRLRIPNFFRSPLAQAAARSLKLSPWFSGVDQGVQGRTDQKLDFSCLVPRAQCTERTCSPLCTIGHNLLRGALLRWLAEITGIPALFSRDDDLALLRYTRDDYVAIHSDWYGDRGAVRLRLAVNWHATERWDPAWGGGLRFFAPKAGFEPGMTVRYEHFVEDVCWLPRFNDLHIIELGRLNQLNVHDVSPVTSDVAERLVLHTFFYTPAEATP